MNVGDVLLFQGDVVHPGAGYIVEHFASTRTSITRYDAKADAWLAWCAWCACCACRAYSHLPCAQERIYKPRRAVVERNS